MLAGPFCIGAYHYLAFWLHSMAVFYTKGTARRRMASGSLFTEDLGRSHEFKMQKKHVCFIHTS